LHAVPPASLHDGALPDRASIEAGALDGLGLELAWVDDPVDAFFLHIQGSGRLRLHDGRLLRVGYAGQNGRPYKAIGKLLIDTGAVPRERMSMQAIRAWLAAAGPGEAADTLRHNPSYVFFRVLEGLPPGQGPPGALGVPLTPGRSLAVDPAFIPFGAPVFAATRDPLDGAPVRRLLHAQDTGGAIRGPARGDLFWGWDEAAAALAGLMRDAAEVFVLVPREESEAGWPRRKRRRSFRPTRRPLSSRPCRNPGRRASRSSSPASWTCTGRTSASRPSSCWRTRGARWRCRARRPAAASPPTTAATAPGRATWRGR
jgi:membrane-bound lytic murein transglycosylase A